MRFQLVLILSEKTKNKKKTKGEKIMEKTFNIRNAHEDEAELLFGNGRAAECCIAAVCGEFNSQGHPTTALIKRYSPAGDSALFRSELHDLLYFLHSNAVNCMLLSAKALAEFCTACDDVKQFMHDDHKIYGFETHTQSYFFYIGCSIEENIADSKYTIRCYCRDTLIQHCIKEDTNDI